METNYLLSSIFLNSTFFLSPVSAILNNETLDIFEDTLSKINSAGVGTPDISCLSMRDQPCFDSVIPLKVKQLNECNVQ